ncbi:MAG: hypothetical protein MUD01_07570 [Chloroflexaceae bacterium]|jgi:hypothetical protein|nr:hypothetical protein [Chloroflexaceae bacterium]
MPITLGQVQELAEQLPLDEQARLIAHVSERLARSIPTNATVSSPHSDAWQKLLAFRSDMEALGAAAPDFAAQLEADRTSRQASLEGNVRVHP